MQKLTRSLLRWYEKKGRRLPWRVSPYDLKTGIKPDPYKVWVSEIMLQQTTVGTVIPYFNQFIEEWRNVAQLSKADQNEIISFWAGLGYYSRARNILKSAKEIMDKHQGKIPEEKDKLKSLPGIGEYTASAIRSIGFQKSDITIDGNIERIITRLFKIETPIRLSKKIIQKKAKLIFPKNRTGDFCQGLMDLANIICKPRKPICKECPISSFCESFKQGETESIPVKAPKKPKPVRKGFVYFIKNNNNKILVERRPDDGLLGGLLAFPSSDWLENEPDLVFPIDAEWSQPFNKIMHEFTHFKLELKLVVGKVTKFHMKKSNYEVFDLYSFNESQLPTLMRKVLRKGKEITAQKL